MLNIIVLVTGDATPRYQHIRRFPQCHSPKRKYTPIGLWFRYRAGPSDLIVRLAFAKFKTLRDRWCSPQSHSHHIRNEQVAATSSLESTWASSSPRARKQDPDHDPFPIGHIRQSHTNSLQISHKFPDFLYNPKPLYRAGIHHWYGYPLRISLQPDPELSLLLTSTVPTDEV